MAENFLSDVSMDVVQTIFGKADENAKLIEDAFMVSIGVANESVVVSGENKENVEKALSVLAKLSENCKAGEVISKQMTAYLCDIAAEGVKISAKTYNKDCICITSRGKYLKPRTEGQFEYSKAIEGNTITFGIGPAGTGKTYLAVAMAVVAFRKNEVSRIVLTRPAVEAGEKLGFLPGDLQSKIDPYLRPLYDALYDVMGAENVQRNLERGTIEIAPLAYMRGRTLDDAFIILDEAQNTTPEQLKMFLTRLGSNSKAVVTGDITQIDLPYPEQSSLLTAPKILEDIDDIAFINLTERDVVRHELVRKIIVAYEKYGNIGRKK